MSAIGGVISKDTGLSPNRLLPEMSRAMILRGRDRRGAYLCRGLGLFYNGMRSDRNGLPLQPVTLTQDEGHYTVVLDGTLCREDDTARLYRELGEGSDAALVLHTYLAFGTEFAKHLRGAFALAICDEKRGEVILARDEDGLRPLYYTTENDSLVFASEIKGLFHSLRGKARIDTGRLRAHLLSPAGSLGAEDLYRDIFSLPAGHCGIHSRLGMNVFPYEREPATAPQESTPSGILPEFYCPDENEMAEMLHETLFAFDYPQFDPLIPSHLKFLKAEAKGRKKFSVVLADGTLFADIGYARERADRLGTLVGLSVQSVPPEKNVLLRERELKKMERTLTRLFSASDWTALTRLLGEDWQSYVQKEKNTARRIRMLGMLYQTLLWEKHYPILFL